MTRWAVFDVDGTLLPGGSMEQRFLVHYAKNGFFPFRNIFYYAFTGLIHALEGNWEDGFKGNKIYLKDMDILSVKDTARAFFHRSILPGFSAAGLQTVKRYRDQGYKIMIMSGSPDFLTCHLQDICQPDYLIYTTLEVFRKRYTGKVAGLHPYGKRKREILTSLQKNLDIDFEESIVFANHHEDTHHMELFGQAVAVNPTSKLREIAQKQNWKIKTWE